MDAIIDTLARHKFLYEGNCHCDGFHTEKYKNGSYQVRVRTRKNQFRIKKDGRSTNQWLPINKLEEALKNIHEVVESI